MVPNSISLTPSMRPSQLLLLLLTLSVGESWSSSQTSESRNRLSFVQLYFSSGSSVLSSSELPSIPPPLKRSGMCDTVPIANRSGPSTSPVPTSPPSTCWASASLALAPLWLSMSTFPGGFGILFIPCKKMTFIHCRHLPSLWSLPGWGHRPCSSSASSVESREDPVWTRNWQRRSLLWGAKVKHLVLLKIILIIITIIITTIIVIIIIIMIIIIVRTKKQDIYDNADKPLRLYQNLCLCLLLPL